MRSFITAMVIAALLIGGGILFNVFIIDISNDLISQCDRATEQIENENYKAASETAASLSEYMDKKKTFLASVISHEAIDEIEMCISELQSYADNGVFSEAAMRCKKLRHLFEHLPANYSLKPQNIL